MTDHQHNDPRSANPPVQGHHVDEIVPEAGGDPYRDSHKHARCTCPECGATFIDGRWTWKATSDVGESHLCPACARIRDSYPAGFLSLRIPPQAAHRKELLDLVANEAEAERREHPLNRVITTEDRGTEIMITTTDDHLPRRIGRAIEHAFGGKLHVRQEPGAPAVHVTWTAPAEDL